MLVKEQFVPILMGANASATIGKARTATTPGEPGSIGGFLPSANGSISITSGGNSVVGSTAVTAGVYVPIPIAAMPVLVVQLADGAAGTLFA